MTGAQESMTSLESEHGKWLLERIQEAKSIKPGMSRTALLKVFREEGGFQSNPPTHYRLKNCWMIKIDVTFSPGLHGRPKHLESDLPIATISTPYLEEMEAAD